MTIHRMGFRRLGLDELIKPNILPIIWLKQKSFGNVHLPNGSILCPLHFGPCFG